MSAIVVTPLSWPRSGRPAAGPRTPPLIVYAIIMIVVGLITLVFAHPMALVAATVACGILFTIAKRNLRRPAVVHIREQLLARPDCLQRWGTDPQRLELAAVFCSALARVMKWPNAYFIPEDPLELALFEISGVDDHLDLVEIALELKKKTGRQINWQALQQVAKTRPPTLADVLDVALGLAKERDEV